MSMYERPSDFPVYVSAASEFDHVVSTQSEAFDADDVAEIGYEKGVELVALLAKGDALAIGKLLIQAKAELVFRRAQIQHYGLVVFLNEVAA